MAHSDETLQALEHATRDARLDGISLDLSPVFSPLPLWMGLSAGVGLVLPLALIVGVPLSLLQGAPPLSLWLALGLLLTLGPVVLQAVLQPTGLQVSLGPHALRVVRSTRLRDRTTVVALSAIRELRWEGSTLVILSDQPPILLPLGERSLRTNRAIASFLEQHRSRAWALGGSAADVPAALSRLEERSHTH